MKKQFLYILTAFVAAAAMTACSGSDGDNGDARTKLLSFIPENSEVVLSFNPKAILQSAGGDWTADKGIVPGKYIDEFVEAVGTDNDSYTRVCDELSKIRGLNSESLVVATYGGVRNFFGLGMITDFDALSNYIGKNDFKKSNVGDFEIYSADNDLRLLLDKTDKLVWCLNGNEAAEAVKTVQRIKSRASSKPLPEWTHKYLGSTDNYVGALVSFDALGINLNGLLGMAKVPADLLGGDISNLVWVCGEKGNKASSAMMTFDSKGNNVPLFNKSIYADADLSAMNLLPENCGITFGLGITGKELFEYLPMLKSVIGDATIAGLVESLKSMAIGVGSFDYDAAMAQANSRNLKKLPFSNLTYIVSFADGKSEQAFGMLAQALPAEKLADGTLKMNLADAGIEGLDALYFSNQQGAVVISSEPVKLSSHNAGVPAGALMYCKADGKAFSGAEMPYTYSSGVWNAEGISGECELAAGNPGLIASALQNCKELYGNLK